MFKRLLLGKWVFLIGVLLNLTFVGTVPAKVFKLQMALSVYVPGSVYQFYQQDELPRRLTEVVKNVTDHELEIVVHPTLIKQGDTVDAVREGSVDIGVQGSMYRGDFALMNVLAFPAIIPFEACPKIQQKLMPIWNEVLKEQFDVEPLGIGYWPRQLLISKRPAATFQDLKGLKFRCHSHSLLDALRRVGGAPVTMPYMEVYLALQRGAIDGAASSLTGFMGGKWQEVAKYVDWWPLGNNIYFFVMNKKSWNKLPPDVQRVFREVFSNAAHETWVASDIEDQRSKAAIAKYGVTHLFPNKNEVTELSKLMAPVVAQWKERAGPRSGEVIAILNEVLGTSY